MSKGFEVEPGEMIDPAPVNTLHANVHHSLDAILERMTQGSGGGAAIIEAVDKGVTVRFKITFADITNQKDCPWCAGTGVDGS